MKICTNVLIASGLSICLTVSDGAGEKAGPAECSDTVSHYDLIAPQKAQLVDSW